MPFCSFFVNDWHDWRTIWCGGSTSLSLIFSANRRQYVCCWLCFSLHLFPAFQQYARSFFFNFPKHNNDHTPCQQKDAASKWLLVYAMNYEGTTKKPFQSDIEYAIFWPNKTRYFDWNVAWISIVLKQCLTKSERQLNMKHQAQKPFCKKNSRHVHIAVMHMSHIQQHCAFSVAFCHSFKPFRAIYNNNVACAVYFMVVRLLK